jgi:hypothetical protein
VTAATGLLDRIVERVPLDGHDGRSGARLERVGLDDGTRLVIKRTSPSVDLAMRVTGATVSREHRLWQAGVLDRLPPGLGHALVDSWQDGDETVLVMRDLGAAVVGWRRTISRAECRQLWTAATAMHRGLAGDAPAGLVPLADRVSLFAPRRMKAELVSGHRLPRAVLQGWERFAEIVSPEVVAAVMGALDRPRRLAGPLSRRSSTLIHGDLWLVNVAFETAQVTLLDWDLATWAPPALELALFLNGNASQVRASRHEVVADFRALWGDDHDEVALRLALFAGLVDLGWNKALDATGHPDPGVRLRERADLNWWVAQAQMTLEQGLLDA